MEAVLGVVDDRKAHGAEPTVGQPYAAALPQIQVMWPPVMAQQ